MNWNDLITVPGIIFLIPIVAIICGSVTALVKMCFQHRERIALIEQGLHPDHVPEDDPVTDASFSETIIRDPAEFVTAG